MCIGEFCEKNQSTEISTVTHRILRTIERTLNPFFFSKSDRAPCRFISQCGSCMDQVVLYVFFVAEISSFNEFYAVT